jgi:hypothetical protein
MQGNISKKPTKDLWLCHICKRRHANACPFLWGGDFVPAPNPAPEKDDSENKNQKET